MNARCVSRDTILWMLCIVSLTCAAQSNATPDRVAKKDDVTIAHAKGTFEVKLAPLSADGLPSGLGRMSIEKQFHGGLEGTSKGEMLSAGTGAKGSSGGYVALEQFSGTLDGRKGTFVLQHSGTMTAGTPQLKITVVPDSGTGELLGLAGTFNLTIADGKHSYDFEYTLPKAQ
jgi:hypothetical protein